MEATQHVGGRKAGEFARLLASVGRLVAEELAAALQSNGLRPLHMAALAGLRGGARSQQALSDLTGADPVRLVGVLNDLEAEELVSRRRDPLDRRRHIVEISDAGQARLAAAESAIAAVEGRLLAEFDTVERRQLELLLGTIAKAGGLGNTCKEALKADEDPGHEERCDP